MRGRSLLTVLLLLGLVGSALLGLAWLWTGESAAPSAVPRTGSPPAPRPSGPELVAPPAGDSPQAVETPATVQQVSCLSAVDRSPLAGVSLYAESEAIAGPSGEDGVLEVERSAHRQRLVLWAPGWGPTRLPSRWPLPEEEVALEPATAGLLVRVTGADPAGRIARTRLVRVGTPVREVDPWAPRLQQEGSFTARGSLLPAGPYHVYVWVVGAGRSLRALPRQEVVLEPGQTLTVELAADTPREGDPDG